MCVLEKGPGGGASPGWSDSRDAPITKFTTSSHYKCISEGQKLGWTQRVFGGRTRCGHSVSGTDVSRVARKKFGRLRYFGAVLHPMFMLLHRCHRCMQQQKTGFCGNFSLAVSMICCCTAGSCRASFPACCILACTAGSLRSCSWIAGSIVVTEGTTDLREKVSGTKEGTGLSQNGYTTIRSTP